MDVKKSPPHPQEHLQFPRRRRSKKKRLDDVMDGGCGMGFLKSVLCQPSGWSHLKGVFS